MPRKTFSITVRVGTRLISWAIVVTPWRSASRGDRKCTGRPSTYSSPPSGACTPAITLPSVDLPAPFSPTSPWMEPRTIETETSRSAWTPPKRLLRSLVSTCGASLTRLAGVLGLELRDVRLRDQRRLALPRPHERRRDPLRPLQLAADRVEQDLERERPLVLGVRGPAAPLLPRQDQWLRDVGDGAADDLDLAGEPGRVDREHGARGRLVAHRDEDV